MSIFLLYSLSYGEVWARRNVYSAPPRYYKCTATHATPRGTHGGPRGVVQQTPRGGVTLNPDPSDLQIAGRASERARILQWLAGFHSHAPRGPSKHASNRPATHPATTAGRQQRQLVGPRCRTPLASPRCRPGAARSTVPVKSLHSYNFENSCKARLFSRVM